MGTICAGDLTISVSDGTNVLYAVTNKQDIVLERGVINALPTITVPSVKVKITGNASAPIAKFYFSGDVASMKYNNSMSSYEPSADVATTGYSLSLNNAYSYKFYFNYAAYDSESSQIGSTTVTNYYAIHSTAVTEVCKQFTSDPSTDLDGGNKHSSLSKVSPFDSYTDLTITFAVSDNPLKGNIMVTEFCGVPGKVYGYYAQYSDPSNKSTAPQITLNSGEVFCTIGGTDYYLREYSNANARFGIKTTDVPNPVVYSVAYDLACWGSFVGLFTTAEKESGAYGIGVSYFFDPA